MKQVQDSEKDLMLLQLVLV